MHTSAIFHDLVKLSPAGLADLIDRVDLEPVAREPNTQARERFRVRNIRVTVQHPGGSEARFLVHGRGISGGEISVIHGGYIHTGSMCELTLRDVTGLLCPVQAHARACRHLEGMAHELTLEFVQEIELDQFLCVDDEHTRELSGTVIYAGGCNGDRLAAAHHLRNTSLHFSAVTDVNTLIAADAGRWPDLIIVDWLPLEPATAAGLGQLRAAGYHGPLIVLLYGNDAGEPEKMREAGARELLVKPVDGQHLIAAIHAALHNGHRDHEPQGENELAVIKRAFCSDAAQWLDELDDAVAEDNRDDALAISRRLRGIGGGLCLGELAQAARQAAEQIRGVETLAEAGAALAELAKHKETCAAK